MNTSAAQFPYFTHAVQAVAAILVAALLLRFHRVYKRPGLLDWTLSWWAGAVSLALGALAMFLMGTLGPAHPWFLAASVTGRAAHYWQEAWLLLGTYAMATGRVPPRRSTRWLLAALFAIAFLLSLPLPLDPTTRLAIRGIFHTLVAGAAFLIAGTFLWLAARKTHLIGARLLALAFLGNGLEQVHFLALGVARLVGWGAGARLVHMGATNAVLQVDFLLHLAIAVAMIVWLLEEEREAAVAASEALRRSEQRYELAARATNDAIWDWDPKTERAVWNRGLETLFGYPLGEGERSGQWWVERVHPADRPRVRAAYRELLGGPGQTLSQEFRFQRADGTYAFVLDRAWVARGGDGEPVRVIGAMTDITAGKEAEAALRESERRYRLLFEANPRPMCVWDVETLRVLAVNDAAAEQYGYSRGEFHSLSVLDLFAPGEAPRFEKLLPMLPPHMVHPEPWRHARKDGTPLDVEIACHAITLGNRFARVLMATDVTGRRRAEAERARLQGALEAAATEWKGTFDAVDVAVLLLDRSGRIARLNRAALEAIGGTPEASLGRHLPELGPGEPWATAAALAERAGRSPATATEMARDPEGGRTWGVSVSRFSTAEMAEERTVVLVRDISELVRLQESLRRKETMSAMGSLVAGVAHEVRNPLFALSSTLDAFEVRYGNAPHYDRYLSVLRSEVERLCGLMRDLLDYGRPQVLDLSPGPLDGAIDGAIRSCTAAAGQADVRIERRVEPNMPPVLRDSGRLTQVFENLILNAVQHSGKGGRVQVEARWDGGAWVECAVWDTGPGFRSEDLPQVFEPFFTRRRGGTGLGLSIVQRIIEQHGGTIAAGNRAPAGARVTLRLPVRAATRASA
jgi:PAS domain S-box-containing protein